MNRRAICAILAAVLAVVAVQAGQVEFNNVGDYGVIEVTPDKSTGLDHIYVLFDSEGVSMSYTASTDQVVTWYDYGNQGGGYAETITEVVHNGRVTTLEQVYPNRGYIIEEGTDRTYLWVVNYAQYYLLINGLSIEDYSECSTVRLKAEGSGDDIIYYTITGVEKKLDRELWLTYNTLQWDDSTHWSEVEVTESLASFANDLSVDAPLCNTVYTLSGDRFLRVWGLTESAESDYLATIAIDAKATAVQETRSNDNEKSDATSGLGGSAPCHIVFTGYPTDAVSFREWQMSYDSEFESVELRYNMDEVDYTFNDAGTYYWRYVVANASGKCEYYSETFMVSIGESELTIPNVFSPGTTEGVNDVWKVSYKSIVDFHCWIFNRWGVLMKEFTDPGDGWDGTYNGKLVDTGVYYYVIRAEGSDGVKYKRSGDINIIRWKYNPHGSSTGSGE